MNDSDDHTSDISLVVTTLTSGLHVDREESGTSVVFHYEDKSDLPEWEMLFIKARLSVGVVEGGTVG